ncbi:MAG: condensation domain-containing protein [Gordonia sp. (in: high G+C Gram-positive bacteria)]
MSLIAAADWSPAPGRILEWRPTESTLAAAAAAPPHPVGPSFLQRDHINGVLAQRAQGREHRGFTCSALTVDEDLDESRMTQAITGFLCAHEGLRSSFTIADGQIVRYVLAAADIGLAVVPAPETDAHAHLARRLPEDAVFDAFPGIAVGVITRPGSFDLYLGVDHAFGDGGSQVLGPAEIIARYRGETSPITGPHGSHIDYTASEYETAATVSAASEPVSIWREVLTAAGGTIPAFPLPLGVDDEPQPVAIKRAELADPTATAALGRLAAAHGTSLIAVVHAALALTERELAGREWYSTATVLSTRKAEHQYSQGWYCNFAPIGFRIVGNDFACVVDDAARALAQAKSAAQIPVHAALGVLLAEGSIDPAVVASPQMVTYLDLGWFPVPENTRDLAVFTGEGRTRNASLWISRDRRGLSIATQHPDNPTAAAAVGRHFDTVRTVLAAAVSDTVGAA